MEKTIEIPEGYEARIEGNKVILELKESEDEKTRKGLIWHLKELRAWKVGTLSPIRLSADYDVWIAYLERQKERGPLSKNEEYTLARIIEYLEDNDCPSEWKDLLHDVYSLPYQKEQQPAEWSEGDKRNIDTLVGLIQANFEDYNIVRDEYPINAHSLIDWLKSLRPQPRQEWSKEDEKRVVELKTFIAKCNGFNKENRKKAFDMIDALRPHWKPSEEQMDELLAAIECLETQNEDISILDSLYKDLKKL